MIRVRPTLPDDAEALAALRARVYPYLVRSPAAVRHLLETANPREREGRWVAEVDGRVVGSAYARLDAGTSEPGAAAAGLHVDPDLRRRGVGSALRTVVEAHLQEIGARRVLAWAQAEAVEHARRHGWEPSREVRYSGVDPRTIPPTPPLPEGVVLCPVSALRPEDLYAAEVATSRDEPGDVAQDAVTFESWRRETWDAPDLDREATTAALVEGRIAAFALLEIVGSSAFSSMTATLRAHRGRGHAKHAKSVALRRAAERGVTAAFTANDEANGPMLAINARLGYRTAGVQWSCLRTL